MRVDRQGHSDLLRSLLTQQVMFRTVEAPSRGVSTPTGYRSPSCDGSPANPASNPNPTTSLLTSPQLPFGERSQRRSFDVPARPDGLVSGTSPGLDHPRRKQSLVKAVRLPRLLPGLIAVLGLFLSQAPAQAAFALRPSGKGSSATVVVLLTVPEDPRGDP